MSNVIKAPVQFTRHGVQLSNIEDAYRFASAIVKSGVAGYKATPETVMIQMQAGMELGFPPMAALKHIHVIQGSPSLSVEGCVALVEKNGGLEPGTKIRVEFSGDPKLSDGKPNPEWSCTAYSTPRGGKELSSTPVYWRQFKHLTGKTDSNWQKFPERMMKARAVGYHIKDYYPAFLFGTHVAEDVEDYHDNPHREVRTVNPGSTHDPALDFLETEIVEVEESAADDDKTDDKSESTKEWLEDYNKEEDA